MPARSTTIPCSRLDPAAPSGDVDLSEHTLILMLLAARVEPGMRLRYILALISVLTAGCSGPYSTSPVSAKDEQALPVRTMRAAVTSIPEVISANGELLAEDSATIGVKVPGRVAKIHVDLGSQVTEGQVLAEIEKSDYEFRVRQAEALVQQTRARLGILGKATDDVVPEETAIVRQAAAAMKEARFIFQTTEKLAREGIVSQIDLEKANVRKQGIEAAYESAVEEVMQLRAQLTERRAQLALARQNLNDCVITAPFSGGITQRHASPGEYLTVNAPVVTLVRQQPLRLRLEVPERSAAKVRIGQRIDVRLEGMATGSGGRVVRISPAMQAQSRSLIVEGEIPNEAGALRAGAFAEGVITVDPNARGIAVPASAVLTFAGIERVFLDRGGVLDDRVVRSGRRLDGERVEILDGLVEGDRVVLEATDRMAKGMKITRQ
jgi:RND family efflux transporter MFP subunit